MFCVFESGVSFFFFQRERETDQKEAQFTRSRSKKQSGRLLTWEERCLSLDRDVMEYYITVVVSSRKMKYVVGRVRSQELVPLVLLFTVLRALQLFRVFWGIFGLFVLAFLGVTCCFAL